MDIRNLIGLYEMFDAAVPFKWVVHKPHYNVADFTLGDVLYRVSITTGTPLQTQEEVDEYVGDEAAVLAPGFDKFYDVEFSASVGKNRPTHMNTGTGNQYKVYATVVDIMKRVMGEFGVGPVYMSAFDESRVSLYPKMLKRLLPGWRVEELDIDGEGYEFIAYPPGMEQAA